jgi:hypothetical protein
VNVRGLSVVRVKSLKVDVEKATEKITMMKNETQKLNVSYL